MIHVMGMTKEHKLEKQTIFTEADLSRFHWVWIDLEKPNQQETKQMMDMFDFHPEALERGKSRVKRPKLEQYNHYALCITHTLREKDNEIEKQELNILTGENFILTTHAGAVDFLNQIREDVSRQVQSEHTSTWTVLYQILNHLTESYFTLVEKIEDELETIEDNTYDKKMNHLMMDLFAIRKNLLHISYTTNPMKDILYQIVHTNFFLDDVHKKRYFTRIYDRLLKLSEIVTTNREITVDIRDNYLSLNSYQTNRLVTFLTIIAAIFTPLTFIAGVYGMNFKNMPELSWNNGYFLALGLMGVIAISMFIWFKVKGWFK